MFFITPDFETRRLYIHHRVWNSEAEKWWEIYIEFLGFNRKGGVVLTEHWRMYGSAYTIIESQRSLSKRDTEQLFAELREADEKDVIPCVTVSIE